MKIPKNTLLSCLLSLMIAPSFAQMPTASAPQKPQSVQSVEKIDVVRYMGTWHEIARLPLIYQEKCLGDVQAHYTLQADNTVQIINSCRQANGDVAQSVGKAWLQNQGGSQLKVSFLPKILRWLPIGRGDYWILRLDADYQTVLIGTPNRQYLWVLSRSPKLDERVLQDYLQTAREQGFDLRQLIVNP